MDINNLKGLMEAYQQVNAPQQIDEISQKTATRAFASRATDEFESDGADHNYTKSGKSKADETKRRIEKKHGKGAGQHAERAADVKTFGRKDASGRRKQSPQPRIQTSDHENQREFKRELRIKRDRRLRAARGEDTNEQVDIFDLVLEFLQVEGYAETLEEAEWMMGNIIDEEAIDIILGEEELDEASRRDEFTRAAIARNSGRKGGITFEPGPNWDPSANRGRGAHLNPKQKEKQRRKALRQEEFEAWLDEAMTNYEKNRKRAAQRAAARNDARAQGKTGAVPGVGYVTPRKERETWTDESGKTRHARGL